MREGTVHTRTIEMNMHETASISLLDKWYASKISDETSAARNLTKEATDIFVHCAVCWISQRAH